MFLQFFLMCICAASLYAEGEVRDPNTDVTFPSQVTFSHAGKDYKLNATGVATRKKLIITVYSVASYLEEGADTSNPDKFAAIMQDDKAHQLTIKYLRNVDITRIKEAYSDSLKRVFAEPEYSQLQKEIDQFMSFFTQDAQKGDEQTLRWLPGGYLEVLGNGKSVGNITNKEFAKGVWNIWFGPNSVVKRENLVSLMK